MSEFDLFIVGGGSGGIRAARYAASKGIKTGLAEGWALGGTCVNRGCIPKKLYAYASHFNDEFKIMKSFGWGFNNQKFNWEKLVENKKKEIKRLNSIYQDLLKNSKVKIFHEFAKFIDNKTLKIGNKYIKPKNILIAVGTKPRKLDSFDNVNLLSSDEAFDLKELPKSILILGGGYIAVEFASIFVGLGIKTTLCIRGGRILNDFDPEVSDFLMNEMKKKGVRFISKDFPTKILKLNKSHKVFFRKKTLYFDKVMEAVGRIPNTSNLHLKNANIKLDANGSIKIDEYFKTSTKNIYAIGDVVDKVQLTPVAIREAMNFVNNLVEKNKQKFNYKNIPTAVFSNPNYSFVGYNEVEARKIYKKINVYKTQFRSLKLSLSNLNEKVFIKLITNAKTDKILGLHYIGENAAEIIQGFAVAIVNGLTKKQLDKTIGIHPTCAEEIVTLKVQQ